jgi:hypothetical protein
MLEASEVLGPAELHNVIAAQGPRVPAARAFDLEGSLEADKIGCRADMLGGHPPPICRGEQLGNIAGCGCRGQLGSLA